MNEPAGLLRKLTLLIITACLGLAIVAAPAAAEFDVVPNGFSFASVDSGGQPETQAAARPYAVKTVIQTTTAIGSSGLPIPDGNPKSLVVDLPAGFVGNPNSLPKCRMSELLDPANPGAPSCAPSTQVGLLSLTFPIGFVYHYGVYNMEPAPGVPAQLGFNVSNIPTVIDASVRPDDHGLRMTIRAMSQGISFSKSELTLWGVPASPAHDADRGLPSGGPPIPSGAPLKAFLANPSDCSSTPLTKLRINAWQDYTWKYASYTGQPIQGCEDVDFQPEIAIEPTNKTAGVPSGYRVELTAEQNDSPTTKATAYLKKAVVTLPEGTVVNPSSAGGLDSCTEAEIGLGTDSEIECPDAARIGKVTIESPIQSELMSGPVYLAKQDANPFGSTLAIYMAPKGGGVQLKLAGEVSPDPVTGQLTTTFDDNPQLPFTSLVMELNGGPRAALVNPPTCGTKTTTAEFSSWSAPDQSVKRTSSFEIDRAPNGRPCATSLAGRSFAPHMAGGSVNPLAGANSEFSLSGSRQDDDKELKTIRSIRLPEGLLGNVASVPLCEEAQAAAGTCSEASKVGHLQIAAGAGPSPVWVPQAGKAPTSVSLTGPYKGAPYGLSIVVPAQAGPFNLGTVVVRSALHLDERTTQLSTGVDEARVYDTDGSLEQVMEGEMPSILKGIPLQVKELRILVDRPGFIVNPTNCSEQKITADAVAVDGQVAGLSNRFQVGDCAALGFAPRFRARILDKGRRSTLRSWHPRTRFAVVPRKGDANIGAARVVLPSSTLLDQANIGTTCTRAQMADRNCPEASIVGYAKAWSPLLRKAVEGPVYLAANGGVRPLPDLAAVLDGEIRVVLQGEISTRRGGGKARLENTFRVVPDAPVSRFVLTMRGGNNRGLLVNSTDLCRSKERGAAVFRGQNGRQSRSALRLATKFKGCVKVRRQAARRAAG